MASLTTIARGAFFASWMAMARPRRMRVPSVAKYSGVTAFMANSPSRCTESMPATWSSMVEMLQNGREAGAPGLQRGGEPGEEAGDQRRRAAERQDADVAQHAHLRPARQELPAQHGAAPLGDEEACQATEQRQDSALREQLRQQARPTHTQRQPNGDLTPAPERPRQQ